MFDSPDASVREVGSPCLWAVRSLAPEDVEALLTVQAKAPLGAVEWSRGEFIAALSNPWNERVGYLCLGLCVSLDQIVQHGEVQHQVDENITATSRIGQGAPQQSAIALDAQVVQSPVSDSDGRATCGMENYFDHVIGGFIILHVVDDEADVQHLAVDLSFNGKGGGRALLGEALSRLTIRDVKAVFLEVRASNARALRLYERAGFRRVGVRVGYYVDTGDDAIVMQYSL